MFPSKEQVDTTRALHHKILKEKEAIESPWLGILPFKMDIYDEDHYLDHTNVLEMMQTNTLFGHYLRFSPEAYPPEQEKESLHKLVRDICLVSRDNGVDLICAGGSRQPICKTLMCSCSRIIDKKHDNKENGLWPTYRKESLHNDRKNNRPHGHQKLNRRCTTKRRLSKSEPTCTFRLNIYLDSKSFFLKVGSGCVFHCHHSILDKNAIRISTRHLLDNDVQLLQDGRQANLSANTARNLFFIRSSGELLSKSQINAITGKATGENESSTDDVRTQLHDYFQKEKAECCFLYHRLDADPQVSSTNGLNGSSGGLNEYHCSTIPTPIVEPAIPVGTPDAEEMSAYACMNRRAQGLMASQDIFLAVAWVLPAEKRLFQLFPIIVHFDAVEDTNNEKRSLFTATGRDSMGKMFTIFRAFLPNQCAWVFRWLFQNVLPKFFGLSILHQISIIVTDGDSQETTQLDIAIKLNFPQVHRARCIWHLVDRGMKKYFPKSLTRKHVNEQLYEKWFRVQKTVRDWIWSWSDDRCETQEEFLLSKSLFIKYIQSSDVKDALGKEGMIQLQNFFKKNIEPHEDFFVFYRRRHIFHLDTNSNSAHEGTNKGMKYHSLPVLPTHSILESTRILTHQSKLKCGDNKIRAAEKAASHARWSDLPTADHLTRLGESILLAQWEASSQYILFGPCSDQWLVMIDPSKRGANVEKIVYTDMIPKFQRVRTVQRDKQTGVLNCSCMYYQRIGIPCRHICCVLKQIHCNDNQFKGPPHTFVSVFWWSMFIHFGISQSQSHHNIRKLLLDLRDNNCPGVLIPNELMPPEIQLDPSNEIWLMAQKNLEERCYNHSKHDCYTVTQNRKAENNAPSTLSQDYFDFNDDEDLYLNMPETTNVQSRNEDISPNEAFEFINPRFRSLLSVIQSKGMTRSYLTELNSDIMKLEEKYLHKLSQKRPADTSVIPCVSSHLPDNNKKKTHGTKHMRYS